MSKQVVRVVEEHSHVVVTSGFAGPVGPRGPQGEAGGLSDFDAEHVRLFIHGGSANYTGNVIDCDGTTTKILDCGDAYL